MTKFFFIALMTTLVVIASHHAPAQTPTPAASATASDVAALREQVEALTEMVKAMQQQVKDQQTLLEKANIVQLLQSEGTPSVACLLSPDRARAICRTSKWAITIRSSADSMPVISNSPSMARSILTSKVSPTLFSNSTTTTKPRSRLRKRLCKQRTCRSVCN